MLMLRFHNCHCLVFFAGLIFNHTLLAGSQINPRTMGAKGDGKTKDTKAIQQAIDAATKTGGTVVLDRGVFLSGTLHLKSRVTLQIEPGATLLGSTEHADYERAGRWLALLEAREVSDIIVTGGGIIDGQGAKLAADVTRLMKARQQATRGKEPSANHRVSKLQTGNRQQHHH